MGTPSLPCPCGKEALWYPDSKHIYGGRDYGPMYYCKECGARVGVHKVGKKPWQNPLGTPAGAKLRRLRGEAHALFDPFWQNGIYKRNEAYRRLAKKLGIPAEDCHIGMFDEEMCKRVIDLIRSKIPKEVST